MGGHHRTRIFLDADVLHSKTLRDWVGLLYTEKSVREPPFDVHWSDDILAEALSSLRNAHPDWPGGQIARVQELITRMFEPGRVRDYDVAQSNFTGKDPGDAHVHAAAIACHAEFLVTQNTKDFAPDDATVEALPYEVITPDTLFTLVDEAHPELVSTVIRRQITHRTGRGEEVDLCGALRAAGCPDFASAVLVRLQQLALTHG